MIAEDVRYNQTLLKNMLENINYNNVTIVDDGIKAIEMIDSCQDTIDKFDCILLDLRMPKVDGYQVLKHIQNKKYTDLEVIVTTASVLDEDIQRCKEIGVKYFVKKPIQIGHLKRALYMCSRETIYRL